MKGVIEHVFVIDGQLDLCVDGEWQSLNCGEGVRFAADVTHVYRNGGEQTVHFHSSSITRAVKRENYFATSRLWLK